MRAFADHTAAKSERHASANIENPMATVIPLTDVRGAASAAARDAFVREAASAEGAAATLAAPRTSVSGMMVAIGFSMLADPCRSLVAAV